MKTLSHSLMIIAVAVALTACQDDRTQTQYVEQASRLFESGDLRAAVIELKNALQKNPDNIQARALLGKIYLEDGNAADAEKELTRARELGAGDDAILPYLARALLSLGEYEKLDALPTEQMHEDLSRAAVLAAKALGRLGKNDTGGAADLAEQAIALAPQSVPVIVARAQVMAALNELDLARAELERAFALDDSDASAWRLAGDLHAAADRLEEADQAYAKALALQPNDMISRYKIGLVCVRRNDYECANTHIAALKNLAPRSPEASYLEGLVDFNTRKFKDAQTAFDAVLAVDDKNTSALFYLAYTHLIQGNVDQAEHYANRFAALAPDSIFGQRLLASIKYENAQFAEAERLIAPVVRLRPDDQLAVDLLAKSLIKQGKSKEAVEFLETELERLPESIPNKLRLAAALIASGDENRGIALIDEVVALDPSLDAAQVLRVTAFIDSKQYDRGVDAALEFVAKKPNEPASQNLLGWAYRSAGKIADAKQAFAKADRLASGDLTANQNLAQIAVEEKDFASARRYYSNILAKDQTNLKALLDLAALDASQNDEAAMLARLQDAAKLNPAAPQPKMMLARYYLARGKPAEVPALLREVPESARSSKEFLELQLQYHLSQKNFEDARVVASQLISATPDDAQAHFLLAWAYDGLGDRKSARNELENTLRVAPDHFAARLAMAYVMLVGGETDNAEKQLALLVERAPTHPGVLRLKAALAGAGGRDSEALALLQQVYETYPGAQSLASLVQQKRRMAAPEDAIALQERWLVENPEDIKTAISLAADYSRNNQSDKAVLSLKQVLAKDQNNIVALNELAWNLRDQDPEAALRYATKAVELAPEVAEIQDTYAMILLKVGRVEEARRSLDRGLKIKPEHPSLRYHSAMIDVAAGNQSAAMETLRSLLNDTNTNFPEREEAVKLLEQLAQPDAHGASH